MGVILRGGRVFRRSRYAPPPAPPLVEPDAAVLGDRPVRVVGDLPGVAVRIQEERAVAAPERLPRLAADRATRRAGLLDHRVDLLGRAEVARERDASPAPGIGD